MPEAGIDLEHVHEDSLAQAYADSRHERLRYDWSIGAWFLWTGARWQRVLTDLGFHWARRVAREFNPSGSRQLARASTARGIESFARADPRLAVDGSRWDLDPMLLNSPGGVVNLRDGTMRPHRREDYITKSTTVTPIAGDAPVWRQFLREATQGDESLEHYLCQLFGYGLTGDTREEILINLYGPGGSGKSTLAGVMHELMGDYAVAASTEVFLETRQSRHPADLQQLKGRRLVIASETQQGRQWDSARVKSLTGNDVVSARGMRENFAEFKPVCKVVVLGNHRPNLSSVDDSWRRRIRIVPLMYKPPAPDPTLKARLRAEFGQILHWAITGGCLSWQESGLITPQCVIDESKSYFEQQDLFQNWIDSECDVGPQLSDTNATLFASWERFCESIGERAW
jgi:putative DNA primase/helicase